jgi:peptidyl-prolyl cis-trans isomerase A (cyclophilin A)
MLTKRALIAFAVAFAAAPAFAQSTSDPYVKLHTAQGDVVIELYAEKAPVTVKNFLHYVDTKRFDGASFFRASTPKGDTAKDYGILEGGLENAPEKLFPPIAHESTAKTGLSHTDGTISMARNAPGTAQANFTICVGDQTYLDASAKDPGYAAFGKVVEGMDVVRKMLKLPTDPNKGVGVMKGEILAHAVVITSARRVPVSEVHFPPPRTQPAPIPPPSAPPSAPPTIIGSPPAATPPAQPQ